MAWAGMSSAITFDRMRPGHHREMRPEEIGGKTKKYSWTQTNWEIRCKVPVDPETTRADIKCSIKRRKFSLYVFEEKIMDGELLDNVDQEASSWQLDQEGTDFPPRLEINITFIKEMETQGRNHWNCIVVGEPTINVEWVGTPITLIHPQDTAALKLLKESQEDTTRPFMGMRDPKAIPGK
eukprot:TRINITY_DN62427_c0_g1_i1.p1 TRINITY_DN62427_c0_g1~~TRINITY_DN62427_c0_g1_i1.p1  ORF type:complete len:181 (-),score=23.77 TRINITY_DN62427_c0_g1_i1:7-549(-)